MKESERSFKGTDVQISGRALVDVLADVESAIDARRNKLPQRECERESDAA
jgi:hypothetical protein